MYKYAEVTAKVIAEGAIRASKVRQVANWYYSQKIVGDEKGRVRKQIKKIGEQIWSPLLVKTTRV